MKRKGFLLVVFAIVVLVIVFFYLILPIISLELIKKQYFEIMNNLNSIETKSGLRALFNRDYNYSSFLIFHM